ncbi:MAG: hypothetical protein ACRET2_14050, partial [Steroidobacteraceae bacterium]
YCSALTSAIWVARPAWLRKGIVDEPGIGGGPMVGSIQLSIMIGAAFGGPLLDHLSVAETLIGGTMLLIAATRPWAMGEVSTETHDRSE